MVQKEISTKEKIPIEKIFENGIILKNNGEYVKIIKIVPINFNLKTELEKASILKSYKEFLKICNFDIQIIIQSNKEDLTMINNKIKNQINEKSKKMKQVSEEYIKFINDINLKRKSASKNYYIIIKNKYKNDEKIIFDELNEKYIKIKESLSRCGNKVFSIEKKEVVEILFSFFNVKKYNLKKGKEKVQ